ncbi:MAG: hypothetical protein ACTSO7_18300 [Candidatus Heimdallarchaeota archaeon]
MTKTTYEKLDSVDELNLVISELLVDGDIRIRKDKNREKFRKALLAVTSKGYIRTHALITNWLLELFKNGEVSSKTAHEIVEELPWSWDQTVKYLDPLENAGIIKSSRDSQGYKIYSLILKKEIRSKQLTNLIEYYKQSGLIKDETPENQSEYFTKLTEWNHKQQIVKQAKNLKQLVPSKTEKFIHELTSLITKTNEEDLPKQLLVFLKKRPLLIRSIERGK